MLETLVGPREREWFQATYDKRIKLSELKRYWIYHPMYYRTDVWNHSHRATTLVSELVPSLKRRFSFDERKAVLMMLIHDDPELITGDEQAGHKAKMTAEQLRALEEVETRAVGEIAKRFPRMIGEYVYEELLHEVNEKRTIESQIVQLGDKLDAVGESFHEVLAGNTAFAIHVVNHYGKIPTPLEYLHGYFEKFAKKCPEVGPALSEVAPFLPLAEHDWLDLTRERTPHTAESLAEPTGFAAYDFWKSTLIKRDPDRQLSLLTTKVE